LSPSTTGDPTQPIGSGVIVCARNEDVGIVASAFHVVRDVAAGELQIGFPVPPSEQSRGDLTMLGARVVATDEGNDLALLETKALFDQVDFVSNHELRSVLGATPATRVQVEQAVAINEEARRHALQTSFLVVAGISLLAVFPAARLPRYVAGELSAEDIVNETDDTDAP